MAALARRPLRRPSAQLLRRGLIPVLARYLPQERLLARRSRATVFAPMVVVWAVLVQSLDRRSSDRAASYQVGQWLGTPLNVRSGALCKARARLPEGELRGMAQAVAVGIKPVRQGARLLRRRRLVVLDASSLTVPDTPANRDFYGVPCGQQPGCGYPVLSLAVLMDGRTGAVLDWVVDAGGTAELLLAQRLLGSLRAGDVLVADRLYGTYGFLVQLRSLGVEVIVRQHQCRQNQRPEGATDWGETWPRPAHLHALHQELCTAPAQAVRVVRQEREERSPLTIVTTLSRAQASAKTILRLYRDRWRIETQLNQLKTGQEADFIRAQSPAAVERAVAGHMLALNLLSAWRSDVARGLGQDPWRLSLTGLRAGVLATAGRSGSAAAHRRWLLGCARSETVPERPGRSEPRRVKRRPKPFSFLTCPRAEARAALVGGR